MTNYVQWEYALERLVDISPGFNTKLDQKGEQGWEAIGIFHCEGSEWVLFKRPKSK